MWNQDGESVPVMDDFSQTRLMFTTKVLTDVIDQSLKNYCSMFDNPSEFENYENKQDPVMYVINITRDYESEANLTIRCDESPNFIYPISDKKNSEIREWLLKVKEF